jgi:truncated hemoglobin YjbI
MTESGIYAFHESFQRCMDSPRGFFDVFYAHFLQSSPDVAAKFSSTDFVRQKQMLKMSLYAMMSAVVLRTMDYGALVPVGRRHARAELNIPPHLYDLWLNSLVNAARACDPKFDADIESHWRDAMQPGIDYIVSLY